MLGQDIVVMVRAYTYLFAFQVLVLPFLLWLHKKFPSLQDALWGFGRFFGIITLAFVVWNLAFLGFPVNTRLNIYTLFLFFLLGSVLMWQKLGWQSWLTFWRAKKWLILGEEFVFLLSFCFLAFTRAFQPEILGLEKFMDAGFIQAYLKSPTLPAQDMWLAGQGINYYTFGQFYASVLVNFWGIDLSYAYNLVLATIFGIFCSQLFSLALNWRTQLQIGKNKLKKLPPVVGPWAILAGSLAVLLVAVGGNGHLMWYLAKNQNLTNYWYPDATRFINHTIHEFPAYSFIVSDLHAHVLNLPVVMSLLVGLWLFFQTFFHEYTKQKHRPSFLKSKTFLLSLGLGLLFSVSVMSNTWDVMTYGVLLLILGSLLLAWDWSTLPILFFAAVSVVVPMIWGSIAWYLHFTSIANGIKVAQEHSPLWQLLVLWGPHFIIALALIILLLLWLKKRQIQEPSMALFCMAVFALVGFLILFPEFFYFKDIYTTYPRANTMFKFLFQAFLLMGILVSLCFSLLIPFLQQQRFFQIPKPRLVLLKSRQTHWQRLLRLPWQIWGRRLIFLYLPLVVFTTFCGLYAYQGYRSYYIGWRTYQGLNGLAWFERKYPDDFKILQYLKRKEPTQVVIVEAVGDSYTEFDRISAFSGMPTIVGWRVHEWLWRGSWDVPAKRSGEVETIYQQPTSTQARELLQRYQVKYIVLGNKEREAYPTLNQEGLLSLGKVIFQSGQSYLIEL